MNLCHFPQPLKGCHFFGSLPSAGVNGEGRGATPLCGIKNGPKKVELGNKRAVSSVKWEKYNFVLLLITCRTYGYYLELWLHNETVDYNYAFFLLFI